MRVLGGTWDVDAGRAPRRGNHTVVTSNLQTAGVVDVAHRRHAAEQPPRVAGAVAGGQHHHVRVEGLPLAGRKELDGRPDTVRNVLQAGEPGRPHHAQPFDATHLLLVDAAVQLVDEVGVDHRAVGPPVVVEQHRPDLVGGVEEVVDRGRVEDLVGERAVVGRAETVAGEDGVHLGPREVGVEVFGHLGRALTSTDDEESPPRCRRHRADTVEQVVVVPDPLGEPDSVGCARFQAGRDDDVAGAAHLRALGAAAAPAHHVDEGDLTAEGDRPQVDDLRAVLHEMIEAARSPLQVVVELVAQREHRLVVDEVHQPVLAVQVRHEAEIARLVAQGDKVLQVRHLHGGAVEQHSPMPAEAFLAFQEGDPQCRRGRYLGVVFLDGDRQGEVRRPEPDPDHVVDTEFRQFSGPLVQTSYHGCPSSHVRPRRR